MAYIKRWNSAVIQLILVDKLSAKNKKLKKKWMGKILSILKVLLQLINNLYMYAKSRNLHTHKYNKTN